MITLKEFMTVVDYRITEGSDYGWMCFGPRAYSLSSWNGKHDGHSLNIVFDNATQTVYTVEVCDYTNNRAYRMINPLFKDAHDSESEDRGVLGNQAWDEVNWIDLETDEDFLEKARAIVNNEHYDTRVQVQVDFTDAELLEYMKIAHDRDITFNELVEIALQEAIDQHRMLNDDVITVKKKKKNKK